MNSKLKPGELSPSHAKKIAANDPYCRWLKKHGVRSLVDVEREIRAEKRRTRQADEIAAAMVKTVKRLHKHYALATHEICGRPVTLKVGVRYIATAPMSAFSSEARIKYAPPITVSIYEHDFVFGALPAFEVCNFNSEGAREFLRAFNNGKISFNGRVWRSL